MSDLSQYKKILKFAGFSSKEYIDRDRTEDPNVEEPFTVVEFKEVRGENGQTRYIWHHFDLNETLLAITTSDYPYDHEGEMNPQRLQREDFPQGKQESWMQRFVKLTGVLRSPRSSSPMMSPGSIEALKRRRTEEEDDAGQ